VDITVRHLRLLTAEAVLCHRMVVVADIPCRPTAAEEVMHPRTVAVVAAGVRPADSAVVAAMPQAALVEGAVMPRLRVAEVDTAVAVATMVGVGEATMVAAITDTKP
jgi:hypothetical protein